MFPTYHFYARVLLQIKICMHFIKRDKLRSAILRDLHSDWWKCSNGNPLLASHCCLNGRKSNWVKGTNGPINIIPFASCGRSNKQSKTNKKKSNTYHFPYLKGCSRVPQHLWVLLKILYLQAQTVQFTAVPVTEMAPSTQTNSSEQYKRS